jgi:hypothetical protein
LLLVHERGGETIDFGELLRRRETVLTGLHNSSIELAVKAGYPHHVEFVEVGSGDR